MKLNAMVGSTGSWVLASCLLFSPLRGVADTDSEGYQPPAVPKYYEEGDGGYQQGVRLKKDYLYLEGLGSLGQSRPSSGKDARLSYGADLKLGYVKALGSWTHLDSSFGLMFHHMESSDTQVNVPYGFKVQFGYGYSIYHNVSAVAKLGIGAVFSRYSDEVDGVTRDANKTTPGLALNLGYGFLLPVSEKIAIDTGLNYTRVNTSVGKVTTSRNTEEDLNKTVSFSNYEFELGIRFIL